MTKRLRTVPFEAWIGELDGQSCGAATELEGGGGGRAGYNLIFSCYHT